MGDVSIREAIATDLPSLLEIEQRIIGAERAYASRMKDGHVHYYDLEPLLTDTDCQILVAEDRTRIVGTGLAQLRQSEAYLAHDRHAYLGFMYVDREHRGEGINQAIIAELIAWSRYRGVLDLSLETYHGNGAAIRAYEKAGFAPSVLEMRLSLAD